MPDLITVTRARLVQCCRELCARCEMGHIPSSDEDMELNHGTDNIGEGQYISSEKCDAAPIWRMIREADGDAIPPCEHGIADGKYCAACSREYKRAAREAGYES